VTDSPKQRQKRIINGKPAARGQWPWQATLLAGDKDAMCGGTLVNKYWILTAKHCFEKEELVIN